MEDAKEEEELVVGTGSPNLGDAMFALQKQRGGKDGLRAFEGLLRAPAERTRSCREGAGSSDSSLEMNSSGAVNDGGQKGANPEEM